LNDGEKLTRGVRASERKGPFLALPTDCSVARPPTALARRRQWTPRL
jgi:hypothetical protein